MKGIVANPLILTGLVVLSIVLLLTPYLIRQQLRLPGRAEEDPLAIRGSSGNWDRRDFQINYTIPGQICINVNGHVQNIQLTPNYADPNGFINSPITLDPNGWDNIDWPNCEFFTVNLKMNEDNWKLGSAKSIQVTVEARGDLFRGTHTESVSGSKILRIGISAVATPTLPPSPTPEGEPTITSQPTVTTTPTTTPPACTSSCTRCDADGNGVYDPTVDGNLIWKNIDTNCDGQKDIADVQWCNGNCIAQPTPTVTVAPGTGTVTANVSVDMGEYLGCGDHLFLGISTPGVLLYHDRYEFTTLTGGTHTFRNVPPGEYDVYAFIIVGTLNMGEEVGLDLETITVEVAKDTPTNLVVQPMSAAATICPQVTITPTVTSTPTATPTATPTTTATPTVTPTAAPGQISGTVTVSFPSQGPKFEEVKVSHCQYTNPDEASGGCSEHDTITFGDDQIVSGQPLSYSFSAIDGRWYQVLSTGTLNGAPDVPIAVSFCPGSSDSNSCNLESPGFAHFAMTITVSPARADVNGDGVEGDILDWIYGLEHYGETLETPQGWVVINAVTLSNILVALTAP